MPPLNNTNHHNNNNNNKSLPWLLNNDSQLLLQLQQQQQQQQRKQHKEAHNALSLIQELCQKQMNHEAPNPKDIETLLSMARRKTMTHCSFFDLIKQYLRQQQQGHDILTNNDDDDKLNQQTKNRRQRIEKEGDDLIIIKTMDHINKILVDQTNNIENVKEECYSLETRMGQLEHELRTRIRKLYPDLSVRSTLL